MSGALRPTAAEQHLGDRLAALIDGELNHDARERVLAHLATCHSCKAEADAQRRVKSVFADTAPPAPSEGLLARLQGLPVTAQDTDRRGDDDGPRSPLAFDYLSGATPPGDRLRPYSGFRVHRLDADRAAGREAERGSVVRGRRRFAFAAAGAFSLAAVTLGGALGSQAPTGQSASSPGPGTAPPRPTAGVERPAERREFAGQTASPTRRGTHSRFAPSGPTAAPGIAARSAPGMGLPYRPAVAHAPGVPFTPVPPPSLRTTSAQRPSPAPGTTPMAVSQRP
ncbi:zf-HC2 domain-containing protein [Streptomyces sp. JJ66]|uniref:zf-HC2 domain-containing protein n=1 Tax=Streptomyces sp. JJ66 TaxID=2803843 RepID=UPI001C5A0E36|nr:zf-HC2 domain-containing protein [Streptomyces sp. JJ66]MBW1602949.1 zf-HC2 domain-containing protein [Streptomyces sp. JJ66]